MIKREKYEPPADAIEALALCLYPAMVAYFEGEEGRKEFAEWQAEQGKEAKITGNKKQEQVA